MPAPNTSDDPIKFVLSIIASSEGFKPNYHEVAVKWGINTPNNAQRRFKKIVEDAGFNLLKGGVEAQAGTGFASTGTNTTTASPRTPHKRSKNGGTKSSSKKRKVHQDDDADSEDVAAENDGDIIKDEGHTATEN